MPACAKYLAECRTQTKNENGGFANRTVGKLYVYLKESVKETRK